MCVAGSERVSWLPDRRGPRSLPRSPQWPTRVTAGAAPGSQWRDRAGFAPASHAPDPVKRRRGYPLGCRPCPPLARSPSRRPLGAAAEGVVARVVRTPALFCLATLTITVTGLALDHFANLSVQMLLALCTWGFLAIAFVYLTPMERAQTSVVVVVATCAEIIGSVIWGVYTYRLGNLPLFVPPGHGLVYLTGLRLSQTPLVPRPGAAAGGAGHGRRDAGGRSSG